MLELHACNRFETTGTCLNENTNFLMISLPLSIKFTLVYEPNCFSIGFVLLLVIRTKINALVLKLIN